MTVLGPVVASGAIAAHVGAVATLRAVSTVAVAAIDAVAFTTVTVSAVAMAPAVTPVVPAAFVASAAPFRPPFGTAFRPALLTIGTDLASPVVRYRPA
ncbi:MAG: hypothetical protein DMF78_04720 [Acidobacteria bacterium]|nr:MAG: hypothetical protein DMF78_04720 [Acidobacteriota bacterium]